MKILFVGLGSIGQRHLRNIKFLYPGAKILAYRELNRNLSLDNKNKKKKYNLNKKYKIKIFKNYIKALDEKPDAVFVCNPTTMHLKYAILAAKKKINIFIDKPISNDLKNLKFFLDLVKKNKITVMIGYQMRFSKAINYIKNLLDKNYLGNLCGGNIFNGEFLPDMHKYENYKITTMANKKLGGGVINSQIHELDYCIYLFGKPTSVYAKGGILGSFNIDVEDYINCIVNFKKKFSINLVLDFFQRPPVRTLKIVGSKKTLTWDYYENEIIIRDYFKNNEKKIRFGKLNRNKLFIDQTKYFFKLLKHNYKKNISSVENGIEGVKFSSAIKKSLKFDKIVKFNKLY
jgi:predicted dehydrogenase